MKTKIKRLWVGALLSGKYQKGTKRLFNSDENTYCVMGVLCKLHSQVNHKQGFRLKPDHEAIEDDDMYYMDECVVLPNAVIKWAGLDTTHPMIDKHSIVSLNDHTKKTFKDLAYLIEKHL